MKKWIVCLALVAVMSFGSRAYAYYEGYIAWDENLVASTNWANTSCVLSWIVSFDSATNYWTYQYTFTTDGKPGISHVITEVSETFDEENVEDGTTASYELGTYLPTNPSNPGIPGSLYGMKFNVPAESDGTLYVWTIVTDRAPIWGDFYAKGGSDTYAYNTQFGVANDSPVEDNPNLIGWAVVPDTVTTIPEPSTLIFLGLGILFIALMLKRNMKSMKIIISKAHKE
jgi:hypothetical protein